MTLGFSFTVLPSTIAAADYNFEVSPLRSTDLGVLMRMDEFQEQLIHELKPSGHFTGDVHHEHGKQGNVLLVN